jgi:hypothetical protein
VSDPYQQQDPYGQQPPPGYGYPPQAPYAQQQQGYGYPPQQPGFGGYPYGGPGPTGQNNGLALASMIVGIVSLIGVCFFGWLTGVVAVGLGIGGLKRSRSTGTGRGQAIGGIVTGALGVLIGVVLIIALVASDSVDSSFSFNNSY